MRPWRHEELTPGILRSGARIDLLISDVALPKERLNKGWRPTL
jgi:hypothetical protein